VNKTGKATAMLMACVKKSMFVEDQRRNDAFCSDERCACSCDIANLLSHQLRQTGAFSILYVLCAQISK
jgi:hypothetical protein